MCKQRVCTESDGNQIMLDYKEALEYFDSADYIQNKNFMRR